MYHLQKTKYFGVECLNPAVYNRNDPVGIMGSNELLMQAVMNNRPRLTEDDVKRIEQETQFIPDESNPLEARVDRHFLVTRTELQMEERAVVLNNKTTK